MRKCHAVLQFIRGTQCSNAVRPGAGHALAVAGQPCTRATAATGKTAVSPLIAFRKLVCDALVAIDAGFTLLELALEGVLFPCTLVLLVE